MLKPQKNPKQNQPHRAEGCSSISSSASFTPNAQESGQKWAGGTLLSEESKKEMQAASWARLIIKDSLNQQPLA